jgi:hypothetical protein
MVHLTPFFLLRSLAPPPPVRPVAAVVCRAPLVHHEKPSRCTVPPPSLIKPNPVESLPPPLKSFKNRWGLKPTSPADHLRSPPLPPGPYKRVPHPRPSSPRSFSLSSPHPRAPSTSSLSLLHRRLPSLMPDHPSPSTNSCSPRRHGEVPCTGTPARPSSGELWPRSARGSMVDRKHRQSTAHGLGPPFFLCKNKSKSGLILQFCTKPPELVLNYILAPGLKRKSVSSSEILHFSLYSFKTIYLFNCNSILSDFCAKNFVVTKPI